MKARLLFLLSLICNPALGAPFLTADPYLTGAPQPESFQLFFNNATAPVTSPAVKCDAQAVANPLTAPVCPTANNSMVMLHDVGSLPKASHTVTAKACSTTLPCSASSPSFGFSTAVLAAPGGIRITP